MTSSDGELKKISTELKHLSLKKQQLQERKKLHCIFQELKNRAEFRQTDNVASHQDEIDSIDDKLRQLTEKKAELQKRHDHILNGTEKKNNREDGLTKSVPSVPVSVSGLNVFFVEAPPTIPAPEVILDLENLPLHPCRTQCPECRQFIMTETFTSVSTVTWLVCFMTAMTGCVAGCCLIPFCVDKFKSVTHRCPKCRTSIRTIKKL